MKRSAFAPAVFPEDRGGEGSHPLPLLLAFIGFSLIIGLAWTPERLLVVALALGLLLLRPAPSVRPLFVLRRFAPLLLLIPLMHVLDWRGFGGSLRLPWVYEGSAWSRGFLSAARMALWILLSAYILEHLRPASLMARLPASPRLARHLLTPVLALAWLDLFIAEAWLLERAWRARGGAGGRGPVGAHWPALLLPLMRKLIQRSTILGESLELRRFPDRWAGRPSPPFRAGDLYPPLLALAAWMILSFVDGGRL